MRQVFGPNRVENGEWRRFHNEELCNLYCSPNIIRVIKCTGLRWAGHIARVKESRNTFKILTRNPTGKRPIGRPGHRWEGNIRVVFKEIGD